MKKNHCVFDIHVHTNYSDGVPSPEEVLMRAKKIGLTGIAITDHDKIEGYLKAKKIAKQLDIVLVPGAEITTPMGDILALGVEEVFDGTPIEIIDKIHNAGGIAIAAHPFGGYWPVSFADLISIFRGRFDAIEVFNACVPLEANMAAMQMAKKHGFTGTGGSDAHLIEAIGTGYTISENEDILNSIRKGKVKVGWV